MLLPIALGIVMFHLQFLLDSLGYLAVRLSPGCTQVSSERGYEAAKSHF
jgi:hypothetical protein